MHRELARNHPEPMRRPLLGIVFCYLAGTFAGVFLKGPDFPAGFITAVLVLIFAFILHAIGKYVRVRNEIFFLSANAFVFSAVFIAGWLAVDLRMNSPSARKLSALMDRPREGIELIGIVSDDPVLRRNWRGDKTNWSFGMQVETVSRTGAFQKARGEIRVRLPQNDVQPHCNERLLLRGVLIDNYRLADLSRTDANRKFMPQRFSFYAENRSVPVLLAQASWKNLFYWCYFIREKCSAVLSRGIEHRPDEIAVLQALVLGRQDELPPAMREAFVATGTYHIFAISGQHVAIIALFIVFLLQFHGIGRLKWFYYLAPVLIIFTVMTGMSSSAVRGCIMALMCFLGPVFKRRTDIPSAMALAALLIIAFDPLQMFQAGFILSFGIVAGLVVLCPPLIETTERFLMPDPYRIEPENWPARNARKIIRWLIFMVIASFSALLVSTPLIARWFNLVSPVALFANLLIIPLATLVLLAGCLSIAFGWFCPFISEAFNFANVFLVSLMVDLTKMMARIPFGHFFVRSPPLLFVCFWFGVLLVWRLYYRKTVILAAAVLLLVVSCVLAWQLNRKEWEIHVLNIGQSAVCLVSTDKAKNFLINAGPNYQAFNVLHYLRRMGVNRIQALACPVPDAKHSGAAKELITALPVNNIWFGAAKQRTRLLNELYTEAGQRRIRTDVLTNRVWRIQSSGNRWLIDGLDGGFCQNTDSAENFSDGPVSIFVNSEDQAQMTVRFLIKHHQMSTVIDTDENSFSGFMNNTCSGAWAEVQWRIVCSPAAVGGDENDFIQPSGFPMPSTIVLGPGQGVLLLPAERGVKIKAITTIH